MNNKMKTIISLCMLFSITSCSRGNISSSSSVNSFLSSGSTSTVKNESSNSFVSSSANLSSSISSSSTQTSTISSSKGSSTSNATSTSSAISTSSVTSTITSTVSSNTSTSSSSSSSVFVDEEKNRILAAIELGIQNTKKVKSGALTYKSTTTKVSNYEYGTDKYGQFSHITEGDFDYYYGYNAANLKYGLKCENRKVSVINLEESEDFVNGPAIKPYSETLYGAKGYMEYMYEMIVSNINYDYESLTLDGGYKFSVGKATSAGTKNYVWINTVEFILEDDAFKSINVTMDKYSNVALNYATNTYYIKPGAKAVATYTISFEQEIGEYTAANPHDIETYYFDSFDLVDSSSVVLEDTLNMKAGVNPEFIISNSIPSTAKIDVDAIKFKLIEGEDNISGEYNSTTKKYTISCAIPGEYVIELSTYKVTKQIKVVVSDPIPESLSLTYYVYTGGFYNPNLITNNGETMSSYVGCSSYVATSFEPKLASQEYDIKVVGDNANNLTLKATTINSNVASSKVINVYELTSSVVGVYEICVTSIENPDLSLTFYLDVKEAPSVESLLSERYVQVTFGEILVDVQFTPSNDNMSIGTVSIEDLYGSNGTYNYEYDSNTRKFKLSNDTNDVSIELSFDDLYKLVYTRLSTGANVTLTVFDLSLMLINAEWQGYYDTEEENVNTFFIFTFNSDGKTGQFSYNKTENFIEVGSYNCSIFYTIKECEDGYSINLSDSAIESIKKSNIVTNVVSITLMSNFKTIISVLEINGEETTIVHNRTKA